MPSTARPASPFARTAAGTFLVAAAIAALSLSPVPAWPQAPGQSTTAGPATRTAPEALNPKLSVQALTGQEREMVEDLAHANLAEIDTGRLALEKSKSQKVRQFAQKMIEDHSAAQKDLQQLAQRKNMQLPAETDFQHKALAMALRVLTGATFDSQYLKQVGVNDHRRTVDLLEKTQRTAIDPELKAYAAKTLPVVQRHLAMAREMVNQS